MRVSLSLCLISTAIAFTGCGALKEKISGKNHPPSARPETSRKVTGPLMQLVERLQKSQDSTDCDRELAPLQSEVAAALDAKTEEIDAFAASLPSTENYKREMLGPMRITVRVNAAPPKKGWQSWSYGWADIHENFVKIRELPVGKEWMELNSWARGRLVDDEKRIIYQQNMYIKREDVPKLQSATNAVERCNADPNCVDPQLTDAEIQVLSANPHYAANLGHNREAVTYLNEWLEYDSVQMKKNTAITRDSDGSFVVPLDPGPFIDVQAQLARIMEDVWQTTDSKVKINWVSATDVPDAYKFIFETAAGGRAFVNHADKSINLYPDDESKAFAHEFGHVLGFPDHYYTSWDRSTCRYTDEQNEEDLMSSVSADGGVTAEEWQELKDLYPVPPST